MGHTAYLALVKGPIVRRGAASAHRNLIGRSAHPVARRLDVFFVVAGPRLAAACAVEVGRGLGHTRS